MWRPTRLPPCHSQPPSPHLRRGFLAGCRRSQHPRRACPGRAQVVIAKELKARAAHYARVAAPAPLERTMRHRARAELRKS